MALDTQHVKDCMCVHHMKKMHIKGMKSCKGESMNHITISCSKQGNMIIPKISYSMESKITHKNI